MWRFLSQSSRENDGLIQKQKGNGKQINYRKPRTIKGGRKHKMERKEMVKMWEARNYKARLEAMATLKMSGCVSPLAMQDKA